MRQVLRRALRHIRSKAFLPLLGVLALCAAGPPAWADDEDDAGAWIPTGQHLTPAAAAGAVFQELNPGLPDFPDFRVNQAVTAVTSHDGKTMLVLSSGFNLMSDAAGKKAHGDEYVFVFDITAKAPRQIQALKVANADSGIVFAPDDNSFYVAGGVSDNVHVFMRAGEAWQEDGAPIALAHKAGLGVGVKPSAAGLGVTADGKRLVVANRYNDSVSIIDLATRAVTGELDLRPGAVDPGKHGVPGGEYPYWVAIKSNGAAYVSAMRDREIVVIDLSGQPRVAARIAVKGTPNRMVLDRAQASLYVASDGSDSVTVVDTAANRVREVIDAAAPPGLIAGPHFRGAAPNALALSPDERTLYVSLGGENALAVIPLGVGGKHAVAGLIPTGWYPNGVALGGDGTTVYAVNGRSDPGPNPQGCSHSNFDKAPLAQCYARGTYILQLSHAGLLTLPAPTAPELARLTDMVAANDGFRSKTDPRDDAVMAVLRQRIKHAVYIIKENRTYDQVLGDLGQGDGDPSLTLFGQAITPNLHALAHDFVTLDNFYDSGEVSGNGWPWSTGAREADVAVKAIPMQYAGRGQTYDVEGTNRDVNVALTTLAARRAANPAMPDDPDLLPGAADVAAPEARDGEQGRGHLWDSALRAHLTVRNYGFFVDMVRYDAKHPNHLPLEHDPFTAHLTVAFPADPALMSRTDPYFRGFDTQYPDFWREREWEREFKLQSARGNMPALSLVRLMTDHMGTFDKTIDGVNTPERQVADNDYAVGRLVDAVAHSPFKDSTLIFVIEDDAQDGPDHVDAHRSIAFVAGPYVKQGAVVHARYTTVNMLRTIEAVLGIEPLSLYDAHQRPMTEIFDLNQKSWRYAAAPAAALRETQLPLPPRQAGEPPTRFADAHDSAYWAERTKGYDWSVEDRIPAQAFNQVLWEGLKGTSPK